MSSSPAPNKLRRYLFMGTAGIAGGVVIGLALAVVRVNSFVHSDDFRRGVEARASEAVGGTVEIHQLNFSFSAESR